MEGCTPQIVGPHYDPTNNSANVNYSIDCNPSAPEQCEIGDLTGKHSQINIGGERVLLCSVWTDEYSCLCGMVCVEFSHAFKHKDVVTASSLFQPYLFRIAMAPSSSLTLC